MPLSEEVVGGILKTGPRGDQKKASEWIAAEFLLFWKESSAGAAFFSQFLYALP